MNLLNNAYALVVGIANYKNIRPLPEAVSNDAREVWQLLTDPAFCGYPLANAHLLLDGDATIDRLRAEFDQLAAQTNPESNVFIYFSCHGGNLQVGSFAGTYLLPVDTRYTYTPELENALSTEELTRLLNAIPASKLTVVLDCCHAGGLTKEGASDLPPLDIKEFTTNDYQRLLGGRGRAVLAASRGSESAWVLNSEHSLFTQHLLSGLRGKASSDDEFIRIFALFNYIQTQVVRERSDQHPILKFEGEEDFPLALYCGGTKKDPTLDKTGRDTDGFRYDAYLSYATADELFVRDVIIPPLQATGIRLTTSAELAFSGIPRVAALEQGVRESRRTLIFLSKAYIEDNPAEFARLITQERAIKKGIWNLIPIKIGEFDEEKLPGGLSILQPVDVTRPDQRAYNLERLAQELKKPAPNWRP